MSWLLIALNILHAHLRLYQRSYAALNINPQHGGLCGEVPVLHSMLLTATQQLSVLVWYAFCNCLVVVCINGPVLKVNDTECAPVSIVMKRFLKRSVVWMLQTSV
jgi:hypothetical protein